jgi:hypothetical protein
VSPLPNEETGILKIMTLEPVIYDEYFIITNTERVEILLLDKQRIGRWRDPNLS